MPTYDYQCSACGHTFEKFQSITSGPLRKCPKCGKNKLKRLIGTGAGLIFKGSGFYITDYRSDSYKDAAKADSKDSKPAETKPAETGKSTETKPAETKPAAEAPAAAKTESPKPPAASKSAAKRKQR
jgi:putative FmdB family regulatory protein